MSGVTLVIEDKRWRAHRGIQSQVKRAADAARTRSGLTGELTILLAGDDRLRELNSDFRGKNKATNVLSFPSSGSYAGDIAIAYDVTKREAQAYGKTFAHHTLHLVVHGVLHLAGFDHERPTDARVMEPLEVKILKTLGIEDPYAPASARPGVK